MLTAKNLGTAALLVAMLAVGAAGWWLRLGPRLHLDVSPLAELPTRIGMWQSEDLAMQPAVEDKLQADFNLQRAYRNALGDHVWLYVGYYSTQRGGRPEHTPRGCYTGAGWGIAASGTVEIDAVSGFRVNEYLVERKGENRLVHFWYRSFRRTGILGGLDQNIDRMLGRLGAGRADGALVRISTPVQGGDTSTARSRLLSLASHLDALLGEHWPLERPCGAGGVVCPTGDSASRNVGVGIPEPSVLGLPAQMAGK